MPRGQPDFGAYAVKDVAATLADMGELAARLGSIDVYDKRGDVVGFDNFEEPILAWNTGITGAGSYVRFDNTNVKSGSQAIKLLTDDVANGRAILSKNIFVPGSLKIGFEISWSYLSSWTDLIIYLSYRSDGIEQRAQVKLDLAVGKLYIRNSDNIYSEVITGMQVLSQLFTFHTIKLVVDFSAAYYTRLLVDLSEYDISSEAIYAPTQAGAERIYLAVELLNQNATGGSVWLEDFIWTQSEP